MINTSRSTDMLSPSIPLNIESKKNYKTFEISIENARSNRLNEVVDVILAKIDVDDSDLFYKAADTVFKLFSLWAGLSTPSREKQEMLVNLILKLSRFKHFNNYLAKDIEQFDPKTTTLGDIISVLLPKWEIIFLRTGKDPAVPTKEVFNSSLRYGSAFEFIELAILNTINKPDYKANISDILDDLNIMFESLNINIFRSTSDIVKDTKNSMNFLNISDLWLEINDLLESQIDIPEQYNLLAFFARLLRYNKVDIFANLLPKAVFDKFNLLIDSPEIDLTQPMPKLERFNLRGALQSLMFYEDAYNTQPKNGFLGLYSKLARVTGLSKCLDYRKVHPSWKEFFEKLHKTEPKASDLAPIENLLQNLRDKYQKTCELQDIPVNPLIMEALTTDSLLKNKTHNVFLQTLFCIKFFTIDQMQNIFWDMCNLSAMIFRMPFCNMSLCCSTGCGGPSEGKVVIRPTEAQIEKKFQELREEYLKRHPKRPQQKKQNINSIFTPHEIDPMREFGLRVMAEKSLPVSEYKIIIDASSYHIQLKDVIPYLCYGKDPMLPSLICPGLKEHYLEKSSKTDMCLDTLKCCAICFLSKELAAPIICCLLCNTPNRFNYAKRQTTEVEQYDLCKTKLPFPLAIHDRISAPSTYSMPHFETKWSDISPNAFVPEEKPVIEIPKNKKSLSIFNENLKRTPKSEYDNGRLKVRTKKTNPSINIPKRDNTEDLESSSQPIKDTSKTITSLSDYLERKTRGIS